METMVGGTRARRISFGEDELLGGRVKHPLAEKILARCPRLASALAAIGARGVPRQMVREGGRLASTMAASRSIGCAGVRHQSLRFYSRSVS
ncbi:MAG: hypothetical protein NT045_09180 [Candidatus Aureabacteria bacterium]|nr:hypothetical protein [Candidatus Auribacterota bacterium]